MVTINLLSTVLMTALLIGIFLALSKIGRRPASPPDESERLDRVAKRLHSIASSPAVWSLLFVAIAIGIGVAVVAITGGFEAEGIPADALTAVVGGVFSAAFAFFVFMGTYTATRYRGIGNAGAAGAGAGALGMLAILLVALQLTVGVIG